MIRIRYETGFVTMIQFIAMSLLNIGNMINSIITSCRRGDGSCASNLFTSPIFFIMTVVWFGFIAMLGYAAQERRSKKLALTLIAAEGMVIMIAYFNARNHTDILSLITSVTDLVLAVWVVWLAARLLKAGGGRIVARRVRQRRSPISERSKD